MWCERNASFVFVGVTLSFSLMFYRSSRPEVFHKKAILKNFKKFTENQLCQRLFFNKIAGLRHAALLKKILRNTFFYRTPSVAAFNVNKITF